MLPYGRLLRPMYIARPPCSPLLEYRPLGFVKWIKWLLGADYSVMMPPIYYQASKLTAMKPQLTAGVFWGRIWFQDKLHMNMGPIAMIYKDAILTVEKTNMLKRYYYCKADMSQKSHCRTYTGMPDFYGETWDRVKKIAVILDSHLLVSKLQLIRIMLMTDSELYRCKLSTIIAESWALLTWGSYQCVPNCA